MSANNNEPREYTAIVEISPQTDDMVETEMAGEADEIKRETKALIAALKRRAQTEAESAGTLTRETYLNAVRQAREAIEREKLIERDRLENSWATMQEETEKNWHLLVKEITDFSDRLQDAAQAAWDAFNAPRP
ncbi:MULTISPECIES: hypothetical protein [unclassified Nodularia (in: cyanobacteria)]|uniref:hypothetical protein n=1 Tax=unclassified Nodularia (in: cyanobacteria) TaxID=2656917 RepID=UPI00187E7DE2|nr:MULTISPECIES: hypothetical protein [unclassified Nodularia (in: cyanobacteria)]MBE9200347.1 hypothetical protein [Nodularia sp. LEGE 06071]MCC2695112.1 hypothetical protein [Nodularia sp. LEGE 04288]